MLFELGSMDPNAMPSDKAQAARERTKEIMRALEDGKPGEADRMMGERPVKGNVGLLPIDWMRSKFKKASKESKKEKEGDGIVR